ncbi:DNA damage response protein-like protein Rtt109 [Macroventuria anomochaeta]|uniref:DNA damage response protein-like protein Rtt109 n=1 Tax=Macroventuria anomochaeta TaxID=301207 RepID=A0ACB6RX71_9PLEO|nr:DNA damage response protein-like protein Rtt109 [Macroventuria anomochaeta]KAF2626615.1 DNA damage response protein-like protein Rtt109 [Macroventuria anomochaeta]
MADTSDRKLLKDLLAEQLPKDVPFTFYHYSTPPSKSPALFSAPPHGKSERTYCESHFLSATITPKDAPDPRLPAELLVLAIEVLIYTTKRLTTIFVSKADSTGYLSELHLPRSQSGSPLKSICGTFVSWLARERQREAKKLVISLFARAQDQYLFPASIDNKNKHVLDDRGLVKWWCKVLDPIIWEYQAEERKPFRDKLAESESESSGTSSQSATTAKGYLVIPGYEPYDTLRYVPPSPAPSTPRRWAAAHPLLQIAPHPAAPPRCLVPHFPDDPKARFLDELDEELPDRGEGVIADGGTPSRGNGMWKSVKTLDQFWDFMAFRQECSSGRIVGFIWVVLTPPKDLTPEEDEDTPSQLSQLSQQSALDSQESLPTPRKKKSTTNKRRTKSGKRYGPIPLILPRIKTSSSNLSTTSTTSTASASKVPENSPYFTWPSSSRGTICFSTKNYNRAHEVLIHSSFATRTATARSTQQFKKEVAVLGGVAEWGWTVVGKKEVDMSAASEVKSVTPVTVMGVRKKRKDGDAPGASEANGAQTLDAGLVRKKAKVEPTPAAPADGANGVQVLGAGLVRRKPKS